MKTKTKVIGVYAVEGETNVYLIELYINAKHTDIDIGEFTQQQDGVDRLNWQAPWDEKYLNNEGTEIIGDCFEVPKDKTENTRLAFFLHFIDFDKPLITPFEEIHIKLPEPMPNRLSAIIEYVQPS